MIFTSKQEKVVERLKASEYWPFFTDIHPNINASGTVDGVVLPVLLDALFYKLDNDGNFLRRKGTLLHGDVGHDAWEYRSQTTHGRTSLHITISWTTGRFSADIDLANPFQDPYNAVVHLGECLWDMLAGG